MREVAKVKTGANWSYTESTATTDALISTPLHVEEWILQYNGDIQTTARAGDTMPISGLSQKNGVKAFKSEYSDDERVIFSLGDDNRKRSHFNDSPQTVTPERFEVIGLKHFEENNGTERNKLQPNVTHLLDMKSKGGIVSMMSEDKDDGNKGRAKAVEITNLTTSNSKTTEREWILNGSVLGTNWSGCSYGDDCSKEFESIDGRIIVIDNEEIQFNDTAREPNKKAGLLDEFRREEPPGCLNCSFPSNVTFIDEVEDTELNPISLNNSTKGSRKRNRNKTALQGGQPVNCSNSEVYDYDCLGLEDHSLLPLGTHA